MFTNRRETGRPDERILTENIESYSILIDAVTCSNNVGPFGKSRHHLTGKQVIWNISTVN